MLPQHRISVYRGQIMCKESINICVSIAFSIFLQREISPLAKCVISQTSLAGGKRAMPEKTIENELLYLREVSPNQLHLSASINSLAHVQ